MDGFVYDRLMQQTARVSVATDGSQGNDGSAASRLSADGRFVAMTSYASNLVPGDINGQTDVFVHDRLAHETTLISVDSASSQGDLQSSGPTLSADGRFVAFFSGATNLVPEDTNDASDVFVRDRLLDRSLRADLAVSQTVQPDPAVPPNPLSPLIYTVTAVNNGPDAAGEVTLYDRPPGNGTLLSVVPSQGECSGGAPFICRLGALEPGASSTVTLTVKPKTLTSPHLRNTAHINAAPFDPQPRNNKLGIRFDLAP